MHIVALLTAVVLLQSVAPASRRAPQESALLERGKRVYAQQRCALCHSIAGKGNTASPLDSVGVRLTPDAIRRWIVAPREMNPKVRKRSYDGLPKRDLDALVAYLLTLGKEPPKGR